MELADKKNDDYDSKRKELRQSYADQLKQQMKEQEYRKRLDSLMTFDEKKLHSKDLVVRRF
jgi:hypothetical protein